MSDNENGPDCWDFAYGHEHVNLGGAAPVTWNTTMAGDGPVIILRLGRYPRDFTVTLRETTAIKVAEALEQALQELRLQQQEGVSEEHAQQEQK